MASPCPNSLTSFSLDLDQDCDLYNQLSLQNPQASSSSSSLSSHIFPNIQDHGGSYYRDSPNFQLLEADLAVPQDRSSNNLMTDNESKSEFNLTVLKTEERNGSSSENGSVKWMNSSPEEEQTPTLKRIRRFEKYDQRSRTEISSNTTIRVCSDCNTTKTPLWRSGPTGPKSLCNACGIRQRKARRAMAVAAMAVTEQTKSNKVEKKERKRFKLGNASSNGGKKLFFEDIVVKLRKNSAFQRVFPQDEKEAAILLMALSYGLVHG